MLPRERVIQVIRHEKPDRIPIYARVWANLEEPVSEAFGSVEAFEDHYEFDFAHIFGGPQPYATEALDELRRSGGGTILPAALLDLPLGDPNDMDACQKIVDQVRHHILFPWSLVLPAGLGPVSRGS
jgi:uroporphyrinogen decarboxylase